MNTRGPAPAGDNIIKENFRMKRSYRAISLCLLLALVLTAFGIFTSFAAPGVSPEAFEQEYGKTVYDMDAIKGDSIAVSNNSYGPNVVRNSDGYWEMNYEGYDMKTAGTAGDYWLAQAPTSVYINNKYTTDSEGNKVITTEKNTDYFVIDFDISTNSSLLDGIYFHNRWYNNTGGSSQQNYIQLNGTDLDNFYLSTHQGGSYVKPATTPGEWLNVTIVYDFSSVDEQGYAVTADWKVMVYFDGIYCGTLPGLKTDAVNFYFNRISTDAGAIQNGPDASTIFANFTYKTFERGYSGLMTQSGVLGCEGCTLADIPELAYCLKDTPVAEDKLIATVNRGGEDIEIYKYDDLDASLQDGDVVTLERSITTALLIDSNATVTFQDKNGTVLTPGTYTKGDLVYIEKPATVDFSSGPVIRRFNQNPRNKNVTDPATTFTYKVMDSYAPVGESSARNYTYILTQDVTYTNSSSPKALSDTLDTDINGYTLTLAHSKRFECSTDSTHAVLKFRNGDLVITGGEITLLNQTAMVVFENINLTQTGGNAFDQRGGMIIYKNVVGTSKSALTNAKGSGVVRSSIIVDGSDITITGTTAISVSNTASSSLRQGSLTVAVRITDSKVSATSSNLVNVNTFANATGDYVTDEETGELTFKPKSSVYSKNQNNVYILIENSDVSSPASPLISTNVEEFVAKKSNTVYVDANEQFTLLTDCIITNSTVTAKYLSYQAASGYKTSLKYQDNYVYNTNVTLDSSDLYMSDADNTLVKRASKLPNTAFSLAIGEEVSCPTNDDSKFMTVESGAAEGNYTLTYTADAQWIKRSLETAPAYTYTNKLETHAYIFDGHEYEFVAYLGDPVNEANIPQELPANSDMLSYRWEYNIDGAWEAIVTYKGELKANVTAADDLALNIYLPATFGDEAYNNVYVEGYKVNVTDVVNNGVAYKAVTIPGIDPASATKDFTIKFRAVDEVGNEATVSCEISVLDYIESALNSEAIDVKGKELVASLLNYIEKVAKYNNPAADLDPALLALLESEAYTSIDLGTASAGEAKDSVKALGVFASARLALDTRFAYEFLVKDEFEGEITLSYIVAGQTVTKTVAVKGGDIVRVELLAYELGTPITVTAGGASGELNFAGYLALISEPSAELTALADAIAIYGAKAAAYMQ